MSNKQVAPPSVTEPLTDHPADDQLDRDDIFEILSNRRRRYILHYLKEHDGESEVELREVVDQVAAWENNTSIENLQSASRKRVYTAIKQSHLPKLKDKGVIKFDRQRGTMSLTDAAREVELYLEYVPEEDLSWGEYYFSLSVACVAVVGASYLGLPLFDRLSGVALVAIIVVLFTLSSIAHLYYSYTHQSRVEPAPPMAYR